MAFKPGGIHQILGYKLQQHLIGFLAYFVEKNIPYFEIQDLKILDQRYPFLSEIVDELGVPFSSKLHPPGL